MIGFSDDGLHFRIREGNEEVLLADDVLFARWRPFDDVEVATWLYWQDGYHVRVHRIATPRRLTTTEGGFAIPRPEGVPDDLSVGPGKAVIQTPPDISALIDLSLTVTRTGKVHIAPPNTNLVAPKTLVPQLMGELPEGVSVLACAVIAGRRPQLSDAVLTRSLPRPDLASLERAVAERGRTVSLMQRPSPA